jgi:phosphate transport system substrate-binding protein
MVVSVSRIRSTLILVATVVVFAAVMLPKTASAVDAKPITGGGSTFSQLLIDDLTRAVRSAPYNLTVNYQGIGSTAGRNGFKNKSLDWAMSDIPYQPPPDDSGTPSDFKYVTLVAGALGFMYNVTDEAGNRITNLKLTPELVCRIFTEPDIKWNDAKLKAENPGVALPSTSIRPFVRADGSGTSYVLSEYCLAVAKPVWDKFIAWGNSSGGITNEAIKSGRPTSNWPVGGNRGAATGATLAGAVANSSTGKGTITYIEAGFADIVHLPLAKVKNAAGVYVAPSPKGITVALSYATSRSDGTFQLDFDTKDAAAYFPSTYSYALVPTGGIDPGKGRTLAEFIYYALTTGQNRAEPNDYARLSAPLITKGLDTAASIPGAPPKPTPGGGTQQTTTTTTRSTATTGAQSGGTTTTRPGSVTATTRPGAQVAGATASPGAGNAGNSASPAARASSGSARSSGNGGGSAGQAGGDTGAGSVGSDPGSTTADEANGDPGATSSDGGAPIDQGGSSGENPSDNPQDPAAEDAPKAAKSSPGPSNSEAIWTMLQGAAILGGGLALAYAFGRPPT